VHGRPLFAWPASSASLVFIVEVTVFFNDEEGKVITWQDGLEATISPPSRDATG